MHRAVPSNGPSVCPLAGNNNGGDGGVSVDEDTHMLCEHHHPPSHRAAIIHPSCEDCLQPLSYPIQYTYCCIIVENSLLWGTVLYRVVRFICLSLEELFIYFGLFCVYGCVLLMLLRYIYIISLYYFQMTIILNERKPNHEKKKQQTGQ